MRAIEQFFHHFGKLRVPAAHRASAYLQCEETAFVRWNHAQVRQAGHVDQATCTVELVFGRQHASLEVNLGGDAADDVARLQWAIDTLAETLPDVPDDPHLLLCDGAESQFDLPDLPTDPVDAAIADIARFSQGLDLVGILAQGPIGAAYADSSGVRHAWQRPMSLLDYSVYAHTDKAIKRSLAGPTWQPAQFAAQLTDVRACLPLLFVPPRLLEPDGYRAWLTPAAVEALLEVLSWTGFSTKAHKTRQSHLQRLADGQGILDARVNLVEDTTLGVGPTFGPTGFAKKSVQLWQNGRHIQGLCGPRTAQEYSLVTDGAADSEEPGSLSLRGGALAQADVLARLGTGLWVDNLWYLNFSDRDACRITGMTRFATLWVENGVPVAPVAVMRFDDTLERMFGTALVDLGQNPELCVDALTWKRRATRGARTPGVLLSDWTLTL